MCGRYLISADSTAIAEHFGLLAAPKHDPRWNVAPGQEVPIVRSGRNGERTCTAVRWGLVPYWSKDPTIGQRMINARSETAAEKPSFRTPLKKRRCLLPADGFYEWTAAEGGKQPWCIRAAGNGIFALAGLWERWTKGDTPLETCTILTTSPNRTLKPIHDRMPVIVQPADYNLWLDPLNEDVDSLQPVLQPAADTLLRAFPVSRHVNRPVNDDPRCCEPTTTELSDE